MPLSKRSTSRRSITSQRPATLGNPSSNVYKDLDPEIVVGFFEKNHSNIEGLEKQKKLKDLEEKVAENQRLDAEIARIDLLSEHQNCLEKFAEYLEIIKSNQVIGADIVQKMECKVKDFVDVLNHVKVELKHIKIDNIEQSLQVFKQIEDECEMCSRFISKLDDLLKLKEQNDKLQQQVDFMNQWTTVKLESIKNNMELYKLITET